MVSDSKELIKCCCGFTSTELTFNFDLETVAIHYEEYQNKSSMGVWGKLEANCPNLKKIILAINIRRRISK